MASEWTTVSYKKQKPIKSTQIQTLPEQTQTEQTQTKQTQHFTTTPKVNVVHTPNKSHSSVNALHVEQKADDGNYTLPTISRMLQTQIQQARNQKGMSQKQLAVACNLQESVIRSYEQGTCLPNSKEMNIMSKILGVTLRNK